LAFDGFPVEIRGLIKWLLLRFLILLAAICLNPKRANILDSNLSRLQKNAAPTTLCASMKRLHVGDADRVQDSEDLDDHAPSLEGDDGVAIPAKPLDSRPPPRAGKRVLPNFGLDAS
jgi:hypothetical protein